MDIPGCPDWLERKKRRKRTLCKKRGGWRLETGESWGWRKLTIDLQPYKQKAHTQQNSKEEGEEQKNISQINTPISETCSIHSRSIPLSLKHVSYTADHYPYLWNVFHIQQTCKIRCYQGKFELNISKIPAYVRGWKTYIKVWISGRNPHPHSLLCHRHGRLARLSLDSFFISLSPTLYSHLLILSFLLSYLFTPHLSYLTHITSCSFSHIPYLFTKCAGYCYDII